MLKPICKLWLLGALLIGGMIPVAPAGNEYSGECCAGR